jgi:gliding motility-associated-like protein
MTVLPRIALAVVILLVAVGCTPSAQLVEQADLSAPSLIPSSSGGVELRYVLSRPATVSLSIRGGIDQSFPLLTDEQRPAAGSYLHLVDGTVPVADRPGERRVLPDGAYTVDLSARDERGRTQAATFDLAIHDADGTAPGIEGLAVYPQTVTPNFDGIDDVAAITYRLTKRAHVFVYATDQAGQRVYVGTQELLEPGEYREVWDGTFKERPLPDGDYQFSIRATDLAGNVVISSVPVRLASSGRPDARIISINFSPQHLMVGDEVQVEAVIRNVGTVPLRTGGPDPGFSYSSFESFSSIANQQYIDRVGVWRFGVDWAGSPEASGSKYPYRWGLGSDLGPGAETTVVGKIRMDHGPNLDRMVGPPQNRFFLYGGLIHEGIAFQDDRVGGTWIEVGY